MANPGKKIVGVLSDLMFMVKIQETAKRAGVESVFVKSQAEALAQAKENPAVMILDLNYGASKPLELIAALKGNQATRDISLLGYVSHVQVDLRRAAEEKGCDVVVARSAFSQNLPELLSRFLPNELGS
ncbi:MAG: response regulator [Acidobacteriota bacterium]|nr:response regulator [Acidobacteriota bacterium]